MDSETIFYKSPLGILEIRGEGDYISAVLFTNSWKGNKLDEEAIHFTTPELPCIKNCVQQLNEYFDGSRRNFELKLKQSGTAFQQQVWAALIDIPYGQTISYLTLSKRIGNVKAIRAVGTANGNNAISILVPCHRVIGSNGDLIGYGGDLWRKKWLLEHEAKHANGVQTLF
ncbi:MAG: methylated-DNA--[protein]-cysteine S-methyltransferase [Chitinophagaceae bacterium]|nr:methylated-DNA--[protein]-cysteine S-methyltransferase [Chitinophagaceae bacterium]